MSEWDKIIGHRWAVDVLRSAIQHNRVGHAYLITGPAQVGKGTLALTFAQALNCTAEEPSQRPCGRCRSCTLIAAGRHPDIKAVEGEASGRIKTAIKIDQIRQLQTELNLTATEARIKVAILEQFEKATRGASNAFLKTLEEPPGNVVLILTANEASTHLPAAIAQRPVREGAPDSLWDESDIILPTITSRCRTIGLRPLPTALIETSLLERWAVEPDLAHLLAHLAGGRIGRAVSLAQNPDLLAERESGLESLYEILEGSRVKRFAAADRLSRDPEALPEVLQLWLGFWRDLVLSAIVVGDDQAISNVDQLDRLALFARTWPTEVILNSLRQTEEALWQLERNANTRLVLENLLLAYPLQLAAPV